eukprot:TRINITY_DN95_c0_g1_i1.p1 TRINITY_DN95_c0_g1~~TRINITY_DN95_c0_g1_i1.p1  ORF type:complete len:146 (-),score=15.91 TRINITY_DN95_c0_g1_i1:121-558(-)
MRHIVCVAILLAVLAIGSNSTPVDQCIQLLNTYHRQWVGQFNGAWSSAPRAPYDPSKTAAAVEALKRANCNQHYASAYGGCVITGCRNQLCADKPQSSCARTNNEECNKYAICGPDGQIKPRYQRCGWVYTPEYVACAQRKLLLL